MAIHVELESSCSAREELLTHSQRNVINPLDGVSFCTGRSLTGACIDPLLRRVAAIVNRVGVDDVAPLMKRVIKQRWAYTVARRLIDLHRVESLKPAASNVLRLQEAKWR